MALIDNTDKWDAITIVNLAMGQIWSEMLAVDYPDLDDTKERVPEGFVRSFQMYAGNRLLNRIAERIMKSEGY